MARPKRRTRAQGQRYTVTLGPRLEEELEDITVELDISKAEAFRRALTLYKYAVASDSVVLRNGDTDQLVLVK